MPTNGIWDLNLARLWEWINQPLSTATALTDWAWKKILKGISVQFLGLAASQLSQDYWGHWKRYIWTTPFPSRSNCSLPHPVYLPIFSIQLSSHSVHTNIRTDNHMINFLIEGWFFLVDLCQVRLVNNKSLWEKGVSSFSCYPHQPTGFFLCHLCSYCVDK
jgi:hypothetical protein